MRPLNATVLAPALPLRLSVPLGLILRLTLAASDSLNRIFVPLGTFLRLRALTAVDFELTANVAGETFNPVIAGGVVSVVTGGGPGGGGGVPQSPSIDRM